MTDIVLIAFFSQPIDLLPCSLDEIRDHLESEGDLSFNALTVLREAEDERRSK